MEVAGAQKCEAHAGRARRMAGASARSRAGGTDRADRRLGQATERSARSRPHLDGRSHWIQTDEDRGHSAASRFAVSEGRRAGRQEEARQLAESRVRERDGRWLAAIAVSMIPGRIIATADTETRAVVTRDGAG